MGEKVGLNTIEKSDLSQLRDWRNRPEFRKYFREYRELSMCDQEKWLTNVVQQSPSTVMFAIRRLDDGLLVGCAGLAYINWINKHADLSIYIGWNNSYIDEKGYAEEACEILMHYGFMELGINKIWSEIYEFDDIKALLFSQLGFRQDGALRKHYYHNGQYWDSLIFSILREDYDQR